MTETTEDRVIRLTELRNRAATAYYTGAEAVMSDAEFDALIAELKTLGVEEIAGHGFIPEEAADGISLPKIIHEYPMQSLTKVHTLEDIVKWEKLMPKGSSFTVQPKYDGFALDLVYDETGAFVQAATRGDHTKGEDVTASVKTMIAHGRIPGTITPGDFQGRTHVRGEAYIEFNDFAALNAHSQSVGGRTYTAKRNTAPGLIRRGDAAMLKFVSFAAYDTNNYQDDEVQAVSQWGFVTPKDHFYVVASTAKEVHDAVQDLGIKRFAEFEFETDGSVIKLRADHSVREDIGSTSTAPRWAIAYKYPEAPVSTVIRSVEWNHNRTGKLTPVAVFDEVVLTGEARTTRATMANYGKFKAFGFRPGDTILVIRANGVIPFIVGLDPQADRSPEKPFQAPEHFPSAEFPTRFSPTGVDLLAHPDAPAPLSAVIENSVKVLELKGIGGSFVDEMVSSGKVKHFLDMLNLTHDDIVEARGIAVKPGATSKSAQTAVETIALAFEQPLWRWIAAIGMKFIATTKSPILESRYRSLDELAEAKMADLAKLEKFSGDVHAETVIANADVIRYWADRLRADHNFEPKPEVREVKEATGSIDVNGKTVVVTGTFPTMGRKDVEQWVKDHGGRIGSSVSAKTDILLYGEKAGSKLDKAQSLGSVTLITGAQFEEEM